MKKCEAHVWIKRESVTDGIRQESENEYMTYAVFNTSYYTVLPCIIFYNFMYLGTCVCFQAQIASKLRTFSSHSASIQNWTFLLYKKESVADQQLRFSVA